MPSNTNNTSNNNSAASLMELLQIGVTVTGGSPDVSREGNVSGGDVHGTAMGIAAPDNDLHGTAVEVGVPDKGLHGTAMEAGVPDNDLQGSAEEVHVTLDISGGIPWDNESLNLEVRAGAFERWLELRRQSLADWKAKGKPGCEQCGALHNPPHIPKEVLNRAYKLGKSLLKALSEPSVPQAVQGAAAGVDPEPAVDPAEAARNRFSNLGLAMRLLPPTKRGMIPSMVAAVSEGRASSVQEILEIAYVSHQGVPPGPSLGPSSFQPPVTGSVGKRKGPPASGSGKQSHGCKRKKSK